MAIAYLSETMKRNLPGLIPMLRHRVGGVVPAIMNRIF